MKIKSRTFQLGVALETIDKCSFALQTNAIHGANNKLKLLETSHGREARCKGIKSTFSKLAATEKSQCSIGRQHVRKSGGTVVPNTAISSQVNLFQASV